MTAPAFGKAVAASAWGITRSVPAVVIGVAATAASVVAVPGVGGWLGAILALLMVSVAVSDLRRFVIPDTLNLLALTFGLADAALSPNEGTFTALSGALLRGAALAAAFYALRVLYAQLRGRDGIGLGDVKLAAVAGAWLSWPMLPIAVEIAALSALCAYGLRQYGTQRPLRATGRLPFGLFFAPAIWICWLLQETALWPVLM